jgi:hypothetical protein
VGVAVGVPVGGPGVGVAVGVGVGGVGVGIDVAVGLAVGDPAVGVADGVGAAVAEPEGVGVGPACAAFTRPIARARKSRSRMGDFLPAMVPPRWIPGAPSS